MKTALIIDNDLGFVFWLGHSLDAAAFSAWPAKSIPDAALLILQLDLTVNVTIINLNSAGAPDFVAALHRSQRDVRVVAILDDPTQAIHVPGIQATHPKPTVLDETARAQWVQCIAELIQSDDCMISVF